MNKFLFITCSFLAFYFSKKLIYFHTERFPTINAKLHPQQSDPIHKEKSATSALELRPFMD